MVSVKPEEETRYSNQSRLHLLLFAGNTRDDLLFQLSSIQEYLALHPDERIEELAPRFGSSKRGDHRLALLPSSRADLLTLIRDAIARLSRFERTRLRIHSRMYYGSGAVSGKIAVLFPGQGSQYPGMLSDLRRWDSDVACWFEALHRAYVTKGLISPLELMQQDSEDLYGFGFGAQLGVVASLALFGVISRLGVKADAFAGHSNGEHSALIAGGLISATDREALCAQMCSIGSEVGALPPPSPPEGMLAVNNLKAGKLESLLASQEGRLFLSVDNCPTQVLVAGYRRVLEESIPSIESQGGMCSRLPFQRAHHTPLFLDLSQLLLRHYHQWRLGEGSTPVYSCLSASPYPRNAGAMWRLLARQWSSTVRFRQTVEQLYRDGVRVFIEAGPDNKLTGIIGDILRSKPHRAFAASSSKNDGLKQLTLLAAELHAEGMPIRPELLDENRPATQLLRERIDVRQLLIQSHNETLARIDRSKELVATKAKADSVAQVGAPPLLGKILRQGPSKLVAFRQFDAAQDLFVKDHALGREGRGAGNPMPVLSFTIAMEIAAEAAFRLTGRPCSGLQAMRAHRWMALECGTLTLTTEATLLSSGQAEIRLYSGAENQKSLCFEALATTETRRPATSIAIPSLREAGRWNAERFYREYAFHGASFQGLSRIGYTGGDVIHAQLRTMPLPGVASGQMQLDPALLDCAGQLAALWLLEQGEAKVGAFPFAASGLRIHSHPVSSGTPAFCVGTVSRTAFDTTRSSFTFCTSSGTPIVSLLDFEQRIVRFPEAIADMLFGSGNLQMNSDDAEFFDREAPIWSNALAHLVLPPNALRQWYSRKDPKRDRILSLFAHFQQVACTAS